VIVRKPSIDISGVQSPLSAAVLDAAAYAREAARWDAIALRDAWEAGPLQATNARIAAAKRTIVNGAAPQPRHLTAARNAATIANDHSNQIRTLYELGLADVHERAEAMGESIFAVAIRHAIERRAREF
jgi:hypothetical protein